MFTAVFPDLFGSGDFHDCCRSRRCADSPPASEHEALNTVHGEEDVFIFRNLCVKAAVMLYPAFTVWIKNAELFLLPEFPCLQPEQIEVMELAAAEGAGLHRSARKLCSLSVLYATEHMPFACPLEINMQHRDSSVPWSPRKNDNKKIDTLF